MKSKTDELKTLDQLIIHAENNTDGLYDMAVTYIYLMASSNIEFIHEYKQRILAVIDKSRGTFRTANALYYLVSGYSLFFLSKPEAGLSEIEKVFESSDDTRLFDRIKGAAYMGRAVCNRSLGHIDKTMEDCLSGVRMIDREQAPEVWHIYIFRMLGEIHTHIGELDEAVAYFLKAREVMDSIDTSIITSAKFRVNDALGICYQEMGKFEEAEKYLRIALGIKNLSKAEKARVLCDLGILYLTDPAKALTYFTESCDIRKEAGLDDAYTTSLLYKAECLLKMDDRGGAEEALKEAEALVDRFGVPSKRLHLYQLYVELNEKKGDYKESNGYFRLYDELKTQIRLEQNKNIFHIKNKQIDGQKQEIERKHEELKNTLSELARIKVSRKALVFTIITVVVLVVLTEVFLDPMIEQYSMNQYISIASKILIAFLLKPIDSLYERLLFRRAYKSK